MPISDREFTLLSSLVYERFGINLTEQKRSLLVGRLQKLLRTGGYRNFKSYYDDLLKDRSGKALDQLINRVSTNYSYFYREEAHFEFFKETVLPWLVKELRQLNSNDLRIWTAGCSTGEEPYMLVMLMLESLGVNYDRWDGGILATDISERALASARQAVYGEERLSRVPAVLRQKYFKKREDGLWQVKEKVRKEVTLRRFNLMNTAFPFKKPFQLIFCRNVMIYFDKPTRDALVRRFHGVLEPGGYLFIGHSETLGREQKLFNYVMPACYRKV